MAVGVKKLGWWQQISTTAGVPPDEFFNVYFMTPPYPAFLEMMVIGRTGDPTWIDAGRDWLDQLATLCDPYPNIEIAAMVGFDVTDEPTGWTPFQNLIDKLKVHSSVTIIGMECEYWFGNVADWTRAEGMVLAAGKQFISYYHPPAPYLEIAHTNFPGGDFELYLDFANDPDKHRGMSNGYYGNWPWPDPNPLPADPTTKVSMGWNKEVIDAVIDYAYVKPDPVRRYVAMISAFADHTFTGVSGRTTDALWDNPQFRDLVWTSPNYQGNFILSTTPAVTHVLTIQSEVGGTTSPSPGLYTYAHGTVVSVAAIPDIGYQFSHWILDGIIYTQNPIDVIVDADRILAAHFVSLPPVGIIRSPIKFITVL